MVDRTKIEQSLKSVHEAHRVLGAFHAEVAAFFQIVDRQLAEGLVGCSLAIDVPKDIVCSTKTSVSKIAEWIPTWMGHIYYDETLQVEEGQDETLDSRAAAAVGILVGEDNPAGECWFGFGRPGEGTRFDGYWQFGRNGLWNCDANPPHLNTWAEGALKGSACGAAAFWQFQRVLLADLTDEQVVQELVSNPLLERWKQVIRGTS